MNPLASKLSTLGQTLAAPLRWPRQLLMAMLLALITANVFADPPARVARLSVLSGEVSFATSEDDNWREANLNRPLQIGDRLSTERDARTELDLGTTALRIDGHSELRLLNLDDQNAQIELPEGTLNLTVRKLYDDQSYEIDTPTLALVIREPGAYRIDARRGATQVTVFDGSADVYGDNNAQQRVTARQSYRFPSASLRDYEAFDLPRADGFDDWCFARDDRYRNPVARQYVSDDVVGYAELDDYGDWYQESSYGAVWYPRRVVSGWAPYRDGHWAWLQPWGWTWVDDAPWGFAPSHYGRWICVRDRWGWVPGPRNVRPVYAPAVVAFIGGNNWSIGFTQSSSPVGWYPLGPQDIYVPSYQVSRNYFQNVNVTNIYQTTVINKTTINKVYNDYSEGRPTNNTRHSHRQNLQAVTAVERDTFVNAKPVARAQRKLKTEDLQRAEVITAPIATTGLSLKQLQRNNTAPSKTVLHSKKTPRSEDRTTSSKPAVQQPAATDIRSQHERTPRMQHYQPPQTPREQKVSEADKQPRADYRAPVRAERNANNTIEPVKRTPTPMRTSSKDRTASMATTHRAPTSSTVHTTKPAIVPPSHTATQNVRRDRVTTADRTRSTQTENPSAPPRSEARGMDRNQQSTQRSVAPTPHRQVVREQVAPQRAVAEERKPPAKKPAQVSAKDAVIASDDPKQQTENARADKRGTREQIH